MHCYSSEMSRRWNPSVRPFTVWCAERSHWTGRVSDVFVQQDLIPTSTLGTGEHGVGVGKKQFLVDELGDGTVELMRTIKKAIDPHNLFNPGKVGSCRAIDRRTLIRFALPALP